MTYKSYKNIEKPDKLTLIEAVYHNGWRKTVKRYNISNDLLKRWLISYGFTTGTTREVRALGPALIRELRNDPYWIL